MEDALVAVRLDRTLDRFALSPTSIVRSQQSGHRRLDGCRPTPVRHELGHDSLARDEIGQQAVRGREPQPVRATELCCDRCGAWYPTSEISVSAEVASLMDFVCGVCKGTHKPV